MNIIFFSDNFCEKIIFWFFTERQCEICRKKGYHLHLFRNTENVIIPCIFFRKMIFHLLSKESYYQNEEIASFLIIQESSYSRASFLERLSFQNIWGKCHIFLYFFGKDRLHFLFKEQNHIFGQNNIILLVNTRKVIF